VSMLRNLRSAIALRKLLRLQIGSKNSCTGCCLKRVFHRLKTQHVAAFLSGRIIGEDVLTRAVRLPRLGIIW